jgi:hypothetical protein
LRSFGLYTASCLAAIALIGAIAWAFTGSAGQKAVLASGGLALGVQLIAFGITKTVQRQSLVLGWGLGSMLRLFVLVLYALVLAKLWRAQIAPGLLSFVGFLFVTTVFEPVFLRR